MLTGGNNTKRNFTGKSERKGRREYYTFVFDPLYQTQVSVCAEAARQNTFVASVTSLICFGVLDHI